ncbi:hypothetical protein [Roseivivax sp. CAU 1761]
MSEIDELQHRIASALDRIAVGAEALERVRPAADPEPPATDPEELAELRAALEDERLANRQLEERVRALKERQEGQLAELRAQIGAGREGLLHLDAELQRMRQANETLEAATQELSRALAEGAGDKAMIDRAMLAELESIRAARAADEAEARAVLGALTPLLADAARAEAADQNGETG